MHRLKGLVELLLLAVVLVSWNGSSDQMPFTGSGGGGFTGSDNTYSIEITADRTELPLNVFNVDAGIGNPYTNTFTVTVKKNGTVTEVPSIAVAIDSGLSNGGSLHYLDGKSEHLGCKDGTTTCTSKVDLSFRTITFDNPPGTATAHFLAGSTPGDVVLVATAQDQDTKQTISASLTIHVIGSGGNAGGRPSAVKFVMDPAPIYISTNAVGTASASQNNLKLFQIFVTDDFGQPVSPSPRRKRHALQVKIVSGPGGGESLSTTDAKGKAYDGATVFTDPVAGGGALVSLRGGTLPGTVVIAATADRKDNNVSNGIQQPITSYATVSVGTGEITSLTFSGPFVEAVVGRLNALSAGTTSPASKEDTLWNGIYSRFITVIASDANGNPPPEGTPITFRLIDSPLDLLQNRYPKEGHGQFAITGYNGDPQEGDVKFFAPNRTASRALGDTLNPFVVPNGGPPPAVANAGCILMLQDPEIINPNSSTINSLPSEGRLEYHVGSRVITGRDGNALYVNEPFNQVSQNVGANVWYTVGCPPQKGNVMNFTQNASGTEVIVTTDVFGVANTIMNYPASQVGRRFMLAAEANGGKVGAVMTHWYLGIPDNSVLLVKDPPELATPLKSISTGPHHHNHGYSYGDSRYGGFSPTVGYSAIAGWRCRESCRLQDLCP
ncbi:MAG: hypothetical protein U1F42_04900 [Candidatus Competibacteraceae bacterium]